MREHANENGASSGLIGGGQTNGVLAWWWRLTAPSEPGAGAPFAARELARRGRLLSVLLLVLLAAVLGSLYQYKFVDDDHPAMVYALLAGLGVAAAAGILNRTGRVTAAGVLVVLLAELPLVGVHATAGRLDLLHLGAFYLMVGTELVAASVLAPWTVFAVAVVNSALIVGSILLLPQTPRFAQALASNDAQQAIFGPVLMQIIVAVVAYLWARSTVTALRRADRAEEIAALERREVERTHELEEGVHQLLDVHVQLANGNFGVRAPAVRNPSLWQIGSSLNNLVARFARLAQTDFALRRTAEESHRLADAIRSARAGRQMPLPAPSGTPVDEVVAALREAQGLPGPAAPGGYVSAPSGGAFTSPGLSWSPAGGALPSTGTADGQDGWPEWLRPGG